ncbi:MAG: glycosyl transferase [Patescibacteria group bacterium]|nr:MAG: glycosyl transferase [Patescibacteria group bacterium]
MEKVIISIIDYNGRDDTIACLRSIEKLVTENFFFEVVVIDNYPQGFFSLGDEKFDIPITIIKTPKALGFAGGQNKGIEYALEQNADYVLVLNNDTLVDKNLLRELVRASREDKKRGAIVPKIYFAKGHEFHKDRYTKDELGRIIWYAGGRMDWNNIYGIHIGVDEVDHGQYDHESETELLTGCCVLLTKDVLNKVKGFDNRYFLYYEDADLNERIKKAGFLIWYRPSALLWHVNAASTGGSGSPTQDYYISRNRLLFGMKYASLRTKIALIRESLRILRSGREWQKKGVIDFYLRRLKNGRLYND